MRPARETMQPRHLDLKAQYETSLDPLFPSFFSLSARVKYIDTQFNSWLPVFLVCKFVCLFCVFFLSLKLNPIIFTKIIMYM